MRDTQNSRIPSEEGAPVRRSGDPKKVVVASLGIVTGGVACLKQVSSLVLSTIYLSAGFGWIFVVVLPAIAYALFNHQLRVYSKFVGISATAAAVLALMMNPKSEQHLRVTVWIAVPVSILLSSAISIPLIWFLERGRGGDTE